MGPMGDSAPLFSAELADVRYDTRSSVSATVRTVPKSNDRCSVSMR